MYAGLPLVLLCSLFLLERTNPLLFLMKLALTGTFARQQGWQTMACGPNLATTYFSKVLLEHSHADLFM